MAYYNMDLKTPSNADVIKQALEEESKINLYPEEKKEKTYSETLFETYEKYFSQIDKAKEINNKHRAFFEDTKEELLTTGLYRVLINPILEEYLATSHEKEVAYNMVKNLVHEQSTYKLLEEFKYKNVYLAEIAQAVNKHMEIITETIDEKIKEGLPEEDIYDIEDDEIENYLLDLEDRVPKDATHMIAKRVQNAVDEFIDNKKKSQIEIKNIYDKAKEKVDEYNQAQAELNIPPQSDIADGDYGYAPELDTDENLNNKLDKQYQDELINNPNMNPAQEAMAWANAQISNILEQNYSVLDAITRILVEGVHKIDSLKESYEKNNKLNSRKVFGDAKAMYTCLEAFNAYGVINVNEEYITNMLKDMRNGIEKMKK